LECRIIIPGVNWCKWFFWIKWSAGINRCKVIMLEQDAISMRTTVDAD
jgi:hypothetical protein